MGIHTLPRHPLVRRGPVRKTPATVHETHEAGAEHGLLETIARDAGFRMPDTIATPEMAEQAGMDIRVLRWIPLYVAAIGVVTVAGLALIATVL